MSTRPQVALATCAELSHFDDDAPRLLAALGQHHLDVESVRWDDPAADWDRYDLVVIRSTWDYAPRRDEFVAWAQRVPRLCNPADIVRWNTHKGYLSELADAGIPVVPTAILAPGDAVHLPTAWEYVVKPVVGAGAHDTTRYSVDQAPAARAHIARLHEAGATAMLQPYLAAVDVRGESALVYLGDEYSHCIRKGPILALSADDVDVYREPTISVRIPDPGELELADRILGAVPGGRERLLYARVDLLAGPDGSPVLIELELAEPSLYLTECGDAAERFANAIGVAAERAGAAVTR